MGRHQAVGVASPTALADGTIEDRKKVAPVEGVTKDRLCKKTASRHMKESAGELDAEGTRHRSRMPPIL